MHGPLKKAIGKDNLTVELPASGMLEDLLKQLVSDHPEMGFKRAEEMTSSYMLLVGSQVVKPDFKLTEDDEVIIFPFVDGG